MNIVKNPCIKCNSLDFMACVGCTPKAKYDKWVFELEKQYGKSMTQKIVMGKTILCNNNTKGD